MRLHTLALVTLAAAAAPAHATMLPFFATPVPGLGIVGVAVTGVVALLIGWWRMRK
jgi:hypothetical protein